VTGDRGTPAGAVRAGFPEAEVLSPQSWVGERAAAVLPSLARAVRERCDPFSTLLVFITGSATHGELCGIAAPDGRRRFLSDIDLGILTERRIPGIEQASIASAVAGVAADAPEPRLGFYCAADLDRQDPTLGLVEGVRCGIVLDGDPAQLTRFRVPTPEAIPPAEAARLLANRVLGWLAAAGPEADAAGRVFAACKLIADLAAVSLLARGAYRGGGYRDRARAARELGGIDPSLRSAVDAWTGWRLTPRWEATPIDLAVDDDRAPGALTGCVRGAVREGLRLCSGGNEVERFLSGVAAGPSVRARSWKRWIGPRPDTILRLRPADFRRTPRGLLWGAAIACALREDGTTATYLSRLGMSRETGGASDAERIVATARAMEREGID
jgi:hypothetical protein